ncbi:hypothetical protein [Tuberibacillus calidus]|uniref:hypothetical protein n=1 Tax=Tuberibacillus calidus TaxID=340097 RepID=UPI000413DFAD|nr:hypothetical protein [Tuberibacillus calidus]
MTLVFNDLVRKYDEENERFLYYNDKLFRDNILIVEDTIYTADDDVEMMISVKYFSDEDACHFTIYQGELLSPIQVYRIVKDIYDFYNGNDLDIFIDLINEFSISTMSASMQSNEEKRKEIFDWVKEPFRFVFIVKNAVDIKDINEQFKLVNQTYIHKPPYLK